MSPKTKKASPQKAPAARKASNRNVALPVKPSAPEVVKMVVPDSSWTRERLLSKIAVDGTFANALTIQIFAHGHMGEHGSVQQTADSLGDKITASKQGSTAVADELLISQAVTLNTVFTELLRRAALNVSAYPEAMERYMRLAFKAQSQSRATLESLAKIKNPPSVAFVRQANIANGPQQVNNGVAASAAGEATTPARTEESGSAPIELLENNNGEWMVPGTTGAASSGDPEMAPVGTVNRAKDSGRKGRLPR